MAFDYFKRIRAPLLFVLAACALIALFIGYSSFDALREKASMGRESVAVEPSPSETPLPSPSLVPQGFSVHLKLPAVDKNDKGALADLTVEITPGNGEVFLRFDSGNPLVSQDTQASLRNAVDVAKSIAREDTSGENIYYSIDTPSDVVGGKSAGAALAVASIAVMKKTLLKPNALITGALEQDGSITSVGKILEKAQAVKQAGYDTLLIPEGEGKQSVQKQSCRDLEDGTQQCNTVTELVDVGKEVGIKIIEVSDVREAFALMKS